MTSGIPKMALDGVDLRPGDLVCWADPRTRELHEGTVRRIFDRFVEVAPANGLEPNMVYTHRLATTTYAPSHRRSGRISA